MIDMPISAILLSPLALVLVGYVLLMIVLAYAVRPLRLKLADTVEQLLEDKRWSARQRATLNNLVDNSFSFLAGLVLPIALVGVTIDEILRRPVERDASDTELLSNPMFDRAMRLFVASVAAANPFAAVLTLVLLLPALIVISMAHVTRMPRNPVEVMEWSALRAATAMRSTPRAI